MEKYIKVKEILLAKKEAVASRIRARLEAETECGGDEADKVRLDAENKLADSLSAKDIDMVLKIDRCLGKIAVNSYGTCEECEEDIAVKRLEANPFAILCISCASAEEMVRT